MGIKVKFSNKFLNDLVQDSNSGIELEVNRTKFVKVSPFELQNLTVFIREYLDSLVATFDPELSGIILSHQKIKVNPQFTVQDDGSNKLLYIADIYVFRPEVGSVLTGVVNQKSEDHVGCLVHRVFNVTIPKPAGGEEEAVWKATAVGQDVRFEVVAFDMTLKIPSIHGKILDSSTPQHSNALDLDHRSREALGNESTAGDGRMDSDSDGLGGVKTQRPRENTEPNRLNDGNLFEYKLNNDKVINRTSLSPKKPSEPARINKSPVSLSLKKLKDIQSGNDSDSFIPPSPVKSSPSSVKLSPSSVKSLNKSLNRADDNFEENKEDQERSRHSFEKSEEEKRTFNVSTSNITFRTKKNNLWINDETFGNVSSYLKNLDSPQSCLRRSVSPSSSNNSPGNSDKRNRSVRFSSHNSVLTFAANAESLNDQSKNISQEELKSMSDSTKDSEGIETETMKSTLSSVPNLESERTSDDDLGEGDEKLYKNRRSPEKQMKSFENSRKSPEKQMKSFENSRKSPEKQTKSYENTRKSPEKQTKSYENTRKSPEKQTKSFENLKKSPEKQTKSSENSRKSPEKQTKSPGNLRNIDENSESDSSSDSNERNDKVSETKVKQSPKNTGESTDSDSSFDENLERKSKLANQRSSGKELEKSDENISENSDSGEKSERKDNKISPRKSHEKDLETSKTSPISRRGSVCSIPISQIDNSFDNRRKMFLENTKSPEKRGKVSINSETTEKVREKLNFDNLERRKSVDGLNVSKNYDVSGKIKRKSNEKESERLEENLNSDDRRKSVDSLNFQKSGDSYGKLRRKSNERENETDDSGICGNVKRKSKEKEIVNDDSRISRIVKTKSNDEESETDDSENEVAQQILPNETDSKSKGSMNRIEKNDIGKSPNTSSTSLKTQQFSSVFGLADETPRRPRRDSEKHDDELKRVSGIESRNQNVERENEVKASRESPANKGVEKNRKSTEETDFRRKLSEQSKDVSPKKSIRERTASICEESTVTMLLKDAFSKFWGSKNRKSNVDSVDASTVDDSNQDTDLEQIAKNKKRKSVVSSVEDGVENVFANRENNKRRSNVENKLSTKQESKRKSSISSVENEVGTNQESRGNKRKSIESSADNELVASVGKKQDVNESARKSAEMKWNSIEKIAEENRLEAVSTTLKDTDQVADVEKLSKKAKKKKSKEKELDGRELSEFGVEKEGQENREHENKKKEGEENKRQEDKEQDNRNCAVVESNQNAEETSYKKTKKKRKSGNELLGEREPVGIQLEINSSTPLQDFNSEIDVGKMSKKERKNKKNKERETDFEENIGSIIKKEDENYKIESVGEEPVGIQLQVNSSTPLQDFNSGIDVGKLSKKERKKKKDKERETDVEKIEESCIKKEVGNHEIEKRNSLVLDANQVIEVTKKVKKKKKKHKREKVDDGELGESCATENEEKNEKSLVGNQAEMDVEKLLKKEKKRKKKKKDKREVDDVDTEIYPNQEIEAEKHARKTKKKKNKERKEVESENQEIRSSLLQDLDHELDVTNLSKKEKKEKKNKNKVIDNKKSLESVFIKEKGVTGNKNTENSNNTKREKMEKFNPDVADRSTVDGYITDYSSSRHKTKKTSSFKNKCEDYSSDNNQTSALISFGDFKKKQKSDKSSLFQRGGDELISNEERKSLDNNFEQKDKYTKVKKRDSGKNVQNSSVPINQTGVEENSQQLNKFERKQDSFHKKKHRNSSGLEGLVGSPKDGYITDSHYSETESKKKSSLKTKRGGYSGDFEVKTHECWTNFEEKKKKPKISSDLTGNCTLDGYITDCQTSKHKAKDKSGFQLKRDGYASDFETSLRIPDCDEGVVTKKKKHKAKKSVEVPEISHENDATNQDASTPKIDSHKATRKRKKSKEAGMEDEHCIQAKKLKIMESSHILGSESVDIGTKEREQQLLYEGGNREKKGRKRKTKHNKLSSVNLENILSKASENIDVDQVESIEKKKGDNSSRDISRKRKISDAESDSIPNKKSKTVQQSPHGFNISDIAKDDSNTNKKIKKIQRHSHDLNNISERVNDGESGSVPTKKSKKIQSKFSDIVNAVESYLIPTRTMQATRRELETEINERRTEIDKNITSNKKLELLHSGEPVEEVKSEKLKSRKSNDTNIEIDKPSEKLKSRKSNDRCEEIDKISEKTKSRKSNDANIETDEPSEKSKSRKSKDRCEEIDKTIEKTKSRKSNDASNEIDEQNGKLKYVKINDIEINNPSEKTKSRKSNDTSNEIDKSSEKAKSRKSNDTNIEINKPSSEQESENKEKHSRKSSEGITSEELLNNSVVTKDSKPKKDSITTGDRLSGTVEKISKTPKKSTEKTSRRKTPRKSFEDPKQEKMLKYFSPVEKKPSAQENIDNLGQSSSSVANSNPASVSSSETIDTKAKTVLSFPEKEKKHEEVGEKTVKKKKKKRKGDDLLELQQEMINRLLKSKST